MKGTIKLWCGIAVALGKNSIFALYCVSLFTEELQGFFFTRDVLQTSPKSPCKKFLAVRFMPWPRHVLHQGRITNHK